MIASDRGDTLLLRASRPDLFPRLRFSKRLKLRRARILLAARTAPKASRANRERGVREGGGRAQLTLRGLSRGDVDVCGGVWEAHGRLRACHLPDRP